MSVSELVSDSVDALWATRLPRLLTVLIWYFEQSVSCSRLNKLWFIGAGRKLILLTGNRSDCVYKKLFPAGLLLVTDSCFYDRMRRLCWVLNDTNLGKAYQKRIILVKLSPGRLTGLTGHTHLFAVCYYVGLHDDLTFAIILRYGPMVKQTAWLPES